MSAGEPLAERRHEKIVRQLIGPLRIGIGRRAPLRLLEAVGSSRRDKPQFAVENERAISTAPKVDFGKPAGSGAK